MALPSGTKLGPYEIQSPLGAGGMGEVYRARDTRLERDVALKVLPANLSSDPLLRQRLEREAKAVSKLSHPHICTLYDIGHQDGMDFLVMELLEGETLEQRLTKGALSSEQTVRYATQIADALAMAHKKGVTHRDLKPANIMLTKTGAKLMDFGLAKQTGPAPLAAALTEMTLEQSRLTGEGTIVGTFQYMAPEQLEGKEADARTDIFALGEVIYEMATGKPTFSGKSRASLIAAILTTEPPPITQLQPLTPPALERVIKKCLAKDPEERWQSASDLASELSWIAETGGQTTGSAPAKGKKTAEALAWAISGVLIIILIAGAIWWRTSKPQEKTLNFYASMPFAARDVALSPNGHTVAVVGYWEAARGTLGTRNVIWIYELGSEGGRSLDGTEGASYPFWSPDGRSIAFFADGKLKKLDVSGGPAQTICDAPSGRGGTWNKDGVIVFTPDAGAQKGLFRVSASGGTPARISTPDAGRGENSHRWPMFLPDGTHYLYMTANFSGRKDVNAIFVGSLDSSEKRFVVASDSNAAYAAPGYLLYSRDKTLVAQRFDLHRFIVIGEPAAILTNVQYQPTIRRVVFAASDDGVLIVQTGSGVALSQPFWFDRKGNEVGVVGKPDVYSNVSLAPNGKSVAVDKTDMDSLNTDVWTYELQRETVKRMTFVSAYNVVPIWSPDSAQLVFASNRQFINQNLYLKNSDGAQEEKNIVHVDVDDMFPSDWSRDGKYILYTRSTDLWFATLPEMKSSLFLKAAAALRNGQFSPDGKWVAYASNETGKWEIYVTSFPEGRGRWQVSTGGGEQPRWRSDGEELFYLSSDNKMMVATVKTGTNFDVGAPVPLFQATPRQAYSLFDLFAYDVNRDGQRFLMITQAKEKQMETAPMSVVLNWTAKLNK
jgi:eukaryotic-like serine/threonine-protein kinase